MSLEGGKASVVIVGAGIMGLSIAYQLARLGVRDVVVLDRGYLCGGASGRNGGGVRAQWSSEENVRLMQESIRMCQDFAAEMKINVWFRQGGYLFVARDAARQSAIEASVALQNRCGLPTRMLTPAEARKVVPELDITGITAASYNPDDGVVFPWPFVWGFAEGALSSATIGTPGNALVSPSTMSTLAARSAAVTGSPGLLYSTANPSR
jgi:sarcosine oxidase subunit beta